MYRFTPAKWTLTSIFLKKFLQTILFRIKKNWLFLFFSGMRLIDGSEFVKMEEALELKAFQGIAYKHIDSAKDQLLKK